MEILAPLVSSKHTIERTRLDAHTLSLGGLLTLQANVPGRGSATGSRSLRVLSVTRKPSRHPSCGRTRHSARQ